MNRRDFLKTAGLAAGAGLVPFLKYLPAEAASRKDTLVVVIGDGINSMDIQRKGTNRPSYQIAVNLYDRLVTFGRKTTPDGTMSYDSSKIEPELAESWEIAADGKAITFHLKKTAKFWDGNPVTAHDVKWSFDRAVSLGGFPTVQMKAGSLEKPEQFVVVDEYTFRIDLPKPSKLALPDLGVPVPIVINSKLAKAHATEQDPWATEYLHKNPAGSGAFKLERWDAGQQFIYVRNDDWTQGPLPGLKRVILREIPSAATRRAVIERGDADFYLDVPAKDAKELMAGGKVKVVGAPIDNCLHSLGLNLNIKPFDDVRVRQAIAYAMPYKEIFEAAAYGRGAPMWGGAAVPEKPVWPIAFPYDTDPARAKELLKEAGFANGFETTLAFNLGLADWQEPAALLIHEALAAVGIKATLEKIPGANWRSAALVEKKLPMHLKNFGGWLNYPDYYFFWAYQNGHLFNSMNYKSDEMEKLVDGTLHMAETNPAYAANIKRMIQLAFDDVPLIPLYQPYLDVATAKDVGGYENWFHRQLDARSLKRV